MFVITMPTEAPMRLRDLTGPELPLKLMESVTGERNWEGHPLQISSRTGKQPHRTPGRHQSYPHFPQQVSHDVEG